MVPGLEDAFVAYTAVFVVAMVLWQIIRSAIRVALAGGGGITVLAAADILDAHPIFDGVIPNDPGITTIDPTSLDHIPAILLDGLVYTDVVGQVLGLHIAGGAAIMALIYKTMELWYSLTWLVAPGSILGVTTFDTWWFEAHAATTSSAELQSCVYAAGIGFTLGVMALAGLVEPEFNSTVPGSRIDGASKTNEDVFDRLNL